MEIYNPKVVQSSMGSIFRVQVRYAPLADDLQKCAASGAKIFLADMAEFAAMNAAWEGWVAKGHTPARATVQAKLFKPEYRVEIQIVAAL